MKLRTDLYFLRHDISYARLAATLHNTAPIITINHEQRIGKVCNPNLWVYRYSMILK